MKSNKEQRNDLMALVDEFRDHVKNSIKDDGDIAIDDNHEYLRICMETFRVLSRDKNESPDFSYF